MDQAATCDACDNTFIDNDDKLIQCDKCVGWIGIACVDMSQDHFWRGDHAWSARRCVECVECVECKTKIFSF